MKRNRLYLPALVVIAFNLVLVAYYFAKLPSELPLHFDLDGNYTSTMPSWRLFLYPAISLVITMVIRWISGLVVARSRKRSRSGWEKGMAALALCIALVILSSTCVTLTAGTNHFFMFAEPVLLLAGIVCAVVSEVKSRKKDA